MIKKILAKERVFFCKEGFTLIEVLVVIAITALLSGMVFANYKDSQKRYALAQDAQKLASDIRKAQNMTISGKEIAGVCSGGVGQSCYGYGVYMEEDDNFYIIYADWDDDKVYKSSQDGLAETIFLSGVIGINSVSFPNGKLDIFFKSPDPTTFINGASGASVDPAEIVLGVIGNDAMTKTISVTSSGLIKSE
ncbi:MAG: prepilin-type N-terminal cleavage/methylation domain-containing protein [Candidatus Marinimicrobia bacterium]|nr:prepilin-type N-terminal cleavage/methylation domain-containing protein [Candidatus Neomarinimicrobiota bacterium]